MWVIIILWSAISLSCDNFMECDRILKKRAIALQCDDFMECDRILKKGAIALLQKEQLSNIN
jgi:hypothetical protein